MQEKAKGRVKGQTSTQILETREYKKRTIVFGKDKYHYMVGIQRGKQVQWKQHFPDTGTWAKIYFDDPDKWGGDFGFLVEEGTVVVDRKEHKGKTLVLARDVHQWMIGFEGKKGKIRWKKYFCGGVSDKFYRRHPNLIGQPMNDIVKAYFANPEHFNDDFGALTA